ncbi:hypothetical protein [Rhizobium leguminosarum]|uniref:hypothetical protein n=1 Tax=Rhizobium leguminosarum TaxID=384 RepID=UPI001AE32CD1|nr:hypothetical protein [Rhizobium leguminosarum]MBP2448985.1 hypothetical protein [Rhizobium leguminosarum]
MSDIVDDLLRLSEDPNADPRSRRRQTMERLVQTLLAMADAEIGPEEAQHRHSIIHLTTIIRDMIRSLQRRRADAARFTVH